MADSLLNLPGKFEKGKSYLLSGETLLAWKSALLADRALPGPGLRENPTPNGRILSASFGGGANGLPLQASLEIRTGEIPYISLAGGAYQVGATGEWVAIPETEFTAGSFAYLLIEQDSGAAVTGVSIVIQSSAVSETLVLDSASPYHVTAAYVLLAEVVSGVIVQRRHGNFTLGLWQIDGSVTRWPDAVVGSLP